MRDKTIIASICVTVLIIVAAIVVNPYYVSNFVYEYGSTFATMTIMMTFFIVLFFGWVVETLLSLRK